MSLIIQPWEMRLLLSAQEALKSQASCHAVKADTAVLQAAYQHCEAITYQHSRTFFLASGLLPREKRLAARALYAFCRITDDIVDEPNVSLSERQIRLNDWRETIMAEHPSHESKA